MDDQSKMKNIMKKVALKEMLKMLKRYNRSMMAGLLADNLLK